MEKQLLVASVQVLHSVKAQVEKSPIYSTTVFQQHAVFATDNTGKLFWETSSIPSPASPFPPPKTCN